MLFPVIVVFPVKVLEAVLENAITRLVFLFEAFSIETPTLPDTELTMAASMINSLFVSSAFLILRRSVCEVREPLSMKTGS